MNTKHNSPSEVDNGVEGKGERNCSLNLVIHAHTKHITYRLKFMVNWEGKGGGIGWSLPVIDAHTKHSSPPEIMD